MEKSSDVRIDEFEKRGKVVDLSSGRVCNIVVGLPTPSGKAASYLLAHEVGTVAL